MMVELQVQVIILNVLCMLVTVIIFTTTQVWWQLVQC